MLTNNQIEIQEKLNFVKHSTPFVTYADLEVGVNQTYFLTSQNSHFPSITLNSGSIFQISNEAAPGIPFRLEIGNLILKPNGPASLMRFFTLDSIKLEGYNGNPGDRGNNGKRTPGGIVQATNGEDGEDGGNGHTILTRGNLYLSIQNLSILPSAPLTRAIFSIDAEGPKGGDGGDGGIGGNGGNGALGQSGDSDCDVIGRCWCSRGIISGSRGANGGAGGYPGNGANGGSGAKVFFAGPSHIFDELRSVVDLQGGESGIGGTGGAGGSGGKGAPIYGGGGGRCGMNHPAKPPGRPGEHRHLIRGTNGNVGNVGGFELVNELPTFENAVDKLFEEFINI